MSDIFLSYSHRDTSFVRDLVKSLEAEGFSVWWDHTIPPGKGWDDVIRRGIEEAKACIVVWSPESVTRDWVKEEAAIAKKAGKYLPIQVGVEEPPMGFTLIQSANLSRWSGDVHDAQWRLLINEVTALVRGGKPAPPPPQTWLEKLYRWMRGHRQQVALLGLGAVALGAVLVAVWWYAVASSPGRQMAEVVKGLAPTTLYPTSGGVDSGVVGTFVADGEIAGFAAHYTDTINADGTYTLTATQEEDGNASGDANGNYRNVGANGGRVHTGSVQIIDATHFQSGAQTYQLVTPVLPPGQPNPSLLGTWSANGVVAQQPWSWIWSSTTPGSYHFEGLMKDHGRTRFANGAWAATSLVTGLSGGGTYGVVDSSHVMINGQIWTRK